MGSHFDLSTMYDEMRLRLSRAGAAEGDEGIE